MPEADMEVDVLRAAWPRITAALKSLDVVDHPLIFSTQCSRDDTTAVPDGNEVGI